MKRYIVLLAHLLKRCGAWLFWADALNRWGKELEEPHRTDALTIARHLRGLATVVLKQKHLTQARPEARPGVRPEDQEQHS